MMQASEEGDFESVGELTELLCAVGFDESDIDAALEVAKNYTFYGDADTSVVGGKDPKLLEARHRFLMLPLDALLLGRGDQMAALQNAADELVGAMNEYRAKLADVKAQFRDASAKYDKKGPSKAAPKAVSLSHQTPLPLPPAPSRALPLPPLV